MPKYKLSKYPIEYCNLKLNFATFPQKKCHSAETQFFLMPVPDTAEGKTAFFACIGYRTDTSNMFFPVTVTSSSTLNMDAIVFAKVWKPVIRLHGITNPKMKSNF
jgi:hypothetical protein